MKQLTTRLVLVLVLLTSMYGTATANDFYWRAVAANNVFSNINNWETAPGTGNTPSAAPSVNDDVFFPVPSNFGTTSGNPILLSNSNCRDFNVTSATGNFFFSGILTAINGNLDCPNGNAVFNFGAAQKMVGAGLHTINLGLLSNRITSGSLHFVNLSGTGTYSLIGPLICLGGITIESQSFLSNGFPISCRRMAIDGPSTKTVDLSNTTLIFNNDGAGANMDFSAPHTSTTYTFTNSQIIWNLTTASQYSGLRIWPGVEVNLNQVTFNSDLLSRKAACFYIPLNSTVPGTVNINLLQLNIANMALGLSGFDNTRSGTAAHCNINIGTLQYLKPNTMTTDRSFSLSIGNIIETTGCAGQSAMICSGYRHLDLSTTTPLSTSTIAFSGVNFGGSGLSTSSGNDLGNNLGTVSWTAPSLGTTFYWVGAAGSWDDPTQWSITGSGGPAQGPLGCLPTLQDDVVFDAASFTGVQAVSLGLSNAFCKNISWTGTNQGSLTGGVVTSSVLLGGNLFVNGNADFVGARGIGANLFFVGTGNHTLNSPTFAPYTSPFIRFMGTGTYTLTNDLIATTSPSILTYLQHSAGTFNTAGFVVDVANFSSRSAPDVASNMRALDITNTEFNIRSTTGAGGRRTIDISFLSALNAAGSHIMLHSNSPTTYFQVARGDASPVYLSTVNLNNISYTSPSCTPLFYTTGSSFAFNCNDVSFASNGNIFTNNASITHTVNNYNFTSGYTYTFTNGTAVYNVLSGINTLVTGCGDLVRIQSASPGIQARIRKTTLPFDVNGAIVADIFSTGVAMNVLSGVDALNNTNVIIGSNTGRDMYWVNNAGNWSDGLGHWSINVSGGDPSINNPLGCIPRAIDDVYFDLNSFGVSGQTVALDLDGNCKNMLWTAAAGSDAPIFSGVATQNLNVYASIELASGMSSPYLGAINMLGTNPGVNTQTFDANGVVLRSSIFLNGGGRYDLLDSVRIIQAANGFRLRKGNFVTNGHKIYSAGMYLDVRGTNAADIRNSKIQLFATGTNVGTGGNVTYTALHDAVGGWQAAGSNIQSDANVVTISNSAPVSYGKVSMNSISTNAEILGNAVQPITFEYVDWMRTPAQAVDGSYMNGVFRMDTLRYPISSFNTLQGGGARSYTILDTIIIFGTPCQPSFLRAATVGAPANVSSALCNFDLKFVNLREINATTCTAAQNRAVGVDEGGNTNWTMTGIGAITPLGNDTAIYCASTPFPISASGFGTVDSISYLWSTSETTPLISVNAAGTYSVVVSYGLNCTATDQIVITCLPPLATQLGDLRGRVQGAVNVLDWASLSEEENVIFAVERSANSLEFGEIGTVTARGNAQQGKDYEFTDSEPLVGLQYYRLRIQDVNGSESFSNTVALTRTADGSGIACYPNPTQGNLTIDAGSMGSDLVATFYNAAGQPVASYAWDNGLQQIELKHLPSALYTLVVQDGQGQRSTTRVQVQR